LEENLSPKDKALRGNIRRGEAYHEAGHAVISVVVGQNVESVSIRTKGTDYRAVCRSTTTGLKIPGKDTTIPFPGQALNWATSTLAGETAMSKKTDITYPPASWEELMEECESLEESCNPDELECYDAIKVRNFCKRAAFWGQLLTSGIPDELPDEIPLEEILSIFPPSTEEEAFELAFEAAEKSVNRCWPAIENVAERLIEVGYLTGEKVEEIVLNSGLLKEAN
jgi:hypothetical protein